MKNNKQILLKTQDFLVSGESFSLEYDAELDMLITRPQPNPDQLSVYYKSENYISHTDSQKSFIDKIYQAVKTRAIHKKVKLLQSYHQPGKLLDIGCGTGDFLVKAKEKGWTVSGIEPNPEARERCVQKNILPKASLSEIQEDGFDVITLWHVLEHLPNLEEQVQSIIEKLKPDGTLIIAVPNFKSYDAHYYKEYWAAYDVPRHLWHFSKTSIKRLFGNHNFHITRIQPMWFDSFYVSLLSEKYKNKKANFLKAMFIGFISNCYGIFKNEYSSHTYILKKDK